MADQGFPPGVQIEDVYVIEARYTPEAAERRAPVRHAHLTRLSELMAAGTLVEAGAFRDMTASLLVVRVGSEEEALELARADVYVEAGVWGEIEARLFGRVKVDA